MILPIIKYPNKILRKKTRQVSFPLSPTVKKLIKDMGDTVKKAEGIGLAAPQVGHDLAIIVVDLETMGVPPFVLINPEVVKFSKKKTDMEEGCLSIPKVFGIVPRPEDIVFKGYNILGKEITAAADGMLAKVLQHEIDHINGILIIDKIKKYTQGQELITAK
ncbi:MAG: def [Candidatus Doudnabacteria bacterium]|nr:def [Candidatus Doudnabacteria bacterium]